LVPRLRADFEFQVHAYNGVNDMLPKLPKRLGAVTHYIQPSHRIVVVRDEDRKNCQTPKRQIEAIARKAGLRPKGKHGPFEVLTRIAIEELEAWFFGDVPALVEAYPGVSPSIDKQRGFRNPDAIAGGTWEAMERMLQRAGHYPAGLAKTDFARRMAACMDASRNTSKSFQVFRDGIFSL